MMVMNSVFFDCYSAVDGIYQIVQKIIISILIRYPELLLQILQCTHTIDIREVLFKQQLQR